MAIPHLRSLLSQGANLAQQTQRRILEIENAPQREKQLRRFLTSEVADIIGVSKNYVLQITGEGGEIPTGEVVGANKRKEFRLEDIHRILGGLYAKARDERYRRQRSPGERLQIVSVANFKGGAAKTTTAVHLAQFLALRGYRVLLVDLDSQASLTSIFGLQPDIDVKPEQTLYSVFRGDVDNIAAVARRTYWPLLDLVPANLHLYQAEFELPVRQDIENKRKSRWRFYRVLDEAIRRGADAYDVVVCDCPPSLGYLSINAIYAATGVLVPVPPSMLDFASTGQFFQMTNDVLGFIEQLDGTEKALDFFKVFASKHTVNDVNQQQIVQLMRRNFGSMMLAHTMANTTALDHAGLRKQTYYEIEAGSGSRQSYQRGLGYLHALNKEMEDLILAAWGRQTHANRAAEVAAAAARLAVA